MNKYDQNISNKPKISMMKLFFRLFIIAIITTLVVILTIHWLDAKKQAAQLNTQKNAPQYLNLIVFQLSNNPIQTTSIDNGVYFQYNDQVQIKTGWINSDAGILVFKEGNKFSIVNGFNQKTNHIDTKYFTNLSQLISESTTRIDEDNPIFSKFDLWINSNGSYNSGKLVSLKDLHITAFTTHPISETRVRDENNNYIIAQSNYIAESKNNIYQIELENNTDDWIYKLKIAQRFEAAFPLEKIYGADVIDLSDALALSPKLHQAVINYTGKVKYSSQDIEDIANILADTVKLKQTLSEDLIQNNNNPNTNLSESEINHLRTIEKITGSYTAKSQTQQPIQQVSNMLRIPQLSDPKMVIIDQRELNSSYSSLIKAVKDILDQYNEFNSDHHSVIIITKT